MVGIRDLDLNLLLIFHEVFQERGVSPVAKRLQLSQPTVSNALARLRRTFGDELFVRTASGLQPTPFAEELAEPVALALQHIARALNRSEPFDPATSKRRFTLAMSDVGEVYFMPSLIERCGVLAPGVQIGTVRARAVDMKEGMETGRIDLAVGAFDNLSAGLYQRRLFIQAYVSMFRRGHPFEGRAVTLKEFVAAQHLMVASTENPYERINQTLKKAGIWKNGASQVPHFVAVPYIVSTTDLVVTVPKKLADSAAGPFNLATIKPPLRLPTLQTNIFWHRRFNQDDGNQWLRNLLFDTFSE
ncbi:MAG: LysR family transcriptional regulator [Herbaspirillum sp.]|nr:LysR family transcriptional regulator [Herbaspirillum sp.]